MPSRALCRWVLGTCCLLAGAVTAQDPSADVRPRQLPTPTILSDLAVMQSVDGVHWGAGRNYKIRFDSASVEFTPLLGTGAPRNMPVRLGLTGVGRADGTIVSASELGAPTISISDLRVEYARGFVSERYDIGVDDVEQSFVFDRLPAGKGDLIVRLDLDTALTPVGDGKKLDLQYDDRGSVHIGAVTGIDARGERAEGTIRYVDGRLELGLPAAFVDSASLPLVLDPTLGSTIQVSNDLSVADEEYPDIAFDSSNSTYLCVWARRFSASDYDVVGQRFDASGSLLGPALLIESDGLIRASGPHVANQNANDMFVVAWTQNSDIYGRAVRASDGAMGAISGIATGSDVQTDLELGNESALYTDDDVLVVFENLTQTTIQARTVHADDTTLALSLPSPGIVTIDADPGTVYDDYDPSIAAHGGEAGVYLVVWRRYWPASGESAIRAKLIDRQLNILSPGYLVVTDRSAPNEYAPVCDGDGAQWVVAYEKLETTYPTKSDVYARTLTRDWHGNAVLGNETNISLTANDDENRPGIAWLGDSVAIAWSDETTATNYEVYASTDDPLNCTSCEPDVTIGASAEDEDYPVIASRFSGGAGASGASPQKDEGFVVWEARDPGTGSSEIRGRRYTTHDGTVADLGGGCGEGGEAFATCPRTPHSGFEFRLARANWTTSSWLIISPGRLDFRCGSCNLVADPFFGIVVTAGTTDPGGSNAIAVPIPSTASLVGAGLYAQWIIAAVPATAGCGSHGFDMSNALHVTIE